MRLADERMGHEDGSVQARHSHVTAAMRGQLLDGLTGHRYTACPPQQQPIQPRSNAA
jgi:hypothetical protein